MTFCVLFYFIFMTEITKKYINNNTDIMSSVLRQVKIQRFQCFALNYKKSFLYLFHSSFWLVLKGGKMSYLRFSFLWHVEVVFTRLNIKFILHYLFRVLLLFVRKKRKKIQEKIQRKFKALFFDIVCEFHGNKKVALFSPFFILMWRIMYGFLRRMYEDCKGNLLLIRFLSCLWVADAFGDDGFYA